MTRSSLLGDSVVVGRGRNRSSLDSVRVSDIRAVQSWHYSGEKTRWLLLGVLVGIPAVAITIWALASGSFWD